MGLKSGLRSLLLADSDILAFVGPKGVRVNRLPEGADFPTIVLKFVSSQFITVFQGINATQARRVQFDVWAVTPRDADKVCDAIHAVLDGYKGVLNDGTTVQGSFPVSDIDLMDEEAQLAGMAVDFNVWYVPAAFSIGTPGNDLPDVDLDITDEDTDGDGD